MALIFEKVLYAYCGILAKKFTIPRYGTVIALKNSNPVAIQKEGSRRRLSRPGNLMRW